MVELLEKHLRNVKGVGIIVKVGHLILMGKRVDSGEWGLAGGSIEISETPKQAAVRELYEEFGILKEDLKYYGVSYSPKNPYKEKDSTEGCSIDFFIEYPISTKSFDINVNINKKEMSEYRWIPLESVLDMDNLYPSSRSSLETFLRI